MCRHFSKSSLEQKAAKRLQPPQQQQELEQLQQPAPLTSADSVRSPVSLQHQLLPQRTRYNSIRTATSTQMCNSPRPRCATAAHLRAPSCSSCNGQHHRACAALCLCSISCCRCGAHHSAALTVCIACICTAASLYLTGLASAQTSFCPQRIRPQASAADCPRTPHLAAARPITSPAPLLLSPRPRCLSAQHCQAGQ